jgi:hypothetical protein
MQAESSIKQQHRLGVSHEGLMTHGFLPPPVQHGLPGIKQALQSRHWPEKWILAKV